MSMDGFVLTALQYELEQMLLPARVNKIYQPSPYEIILHLRRPGESLQLLLSAHPRQARVHLTDRDRKNPTKPPHFCLLLRKHLMGSHLIAIKRPHFERILNFHFQTNDELGEPIQRVVTLEIMGKHSNIILSREEGGEILDSIKRVTPSMSRYRQILPGLPYTLPPAQEKIDPRQVKELNFYSSLQVRNEPLPQAIIRVFAGIGPLLAKELIHRASLSPEVLPRELDRQQLRLLWQHFSQLVDVVENHALEPSVVLDQNKFPIAFSFIPLHQFEGHEQFPCSRLNTAADLYYYQQETQQAGIIRRQQLQGAIEKEMNRLKKTIAQQEAEMEKIQEGEKYRYMGELLTANLFRISPGDSYIEVVDYQSPAKAKIEIPLEPNLTPAANAQRYFHRYRKSKKGKPQLQHQLTKNKDDLTYLESVALALFHASNDEEIAEIEKELISQGFGQKQYVVHGKRAKHDKAPSTPHPTIYRSSDGFTILVGKNNRQNDYLTRRLAKGEDYWFHAQGIPGSHVIVRCPAGKVPPASTLEDAALLAAYYSNGRWSNQVAVDYTRVKNVRKPRGARPGMVIYNGHKTIFITPRKRDLAKLKIIDQEGED